ncbi:MAG: NAD(+) synthase, partial [Erythrobacter sp. 34-65-8]
MHRAGEKIRIWREAHRPPLSAEEFGARYGAPEPWPSRTVYGWEAKGKIARPGVQKRLAELGVCQPADWLEPALGQVNTKDKRPMGATHRFYDIHTHGLVRVATATPLLRPADVAYNAQGILAQAREAAARQVDLVLYPELSLSAYAIDDLHLQGALLEAVEAQIAAICAATRDLATVLVIGAPLRRNGRVYNCALALCRGDVLGVVPKSFLPNYREYYEKRWFAHGRHSIGQTIALGGREVPFGTDLLFAHPVIPGFVFGIEICEDFWAPVPPSTRAALAGATVLLNLSASNITIGKADERHLLCRSQSSRAACAYVYSASGHGESTTDLAWDGQGMIYELGDLMAESARFDLVPELCVVDIDCQRILNDRQRMGTFNDGAEADGHPENRYRRIAFDHRPTPGDKGLIRPVRRFPFVPNRQDKLDEDCYEAFNIQVSGLIRRIEATQPKSLVIGISGGLDSTHALIVAAKACDALGLPRSTIRGYTMPGFATSEGTKSNAWRLMEAIGIT